jgi:hypothetical protein
MATPEKTRQAMARWRAWMADLVDQGHLRNAGVPLERSGKVVRGTAKEVMDGPFAETKELVGGFSIDEAKDAAEAARFAAGCPVLEGGGSVEVRPVRKFDPR